MCDGINSALAEKFRIVNIGARLVDPLTAHIRKQLLFI